AVRHIDGDVVYAIGVAVVRRLEVGRGLERHDASRRIDVEQGVVAAAAKRIGQAPVGRGAVGIRCHGGVGGSAVFRSVSGRTGAEDRRNVVGVSDGNRDRLVVRQRAVGRTYDHLVGVV